jgi:hypothetical protein
MIVFFVCVCVVCGECMHWPPGYNDFEYAVADFAIAVAGMVSVGIHGTYTAKEAVGAINTVGCGALLFMQDLAWHSQRQAMGRWAVQDVRQGCPSVRVFVAMDSAVRIGAEDGDEGTQQPSFEADQSFLDWVRGCANHPIPVEVG